MSYQPYGPQDLDLINQVLQQHPEVDEVIRALKTISSKGKYPIQSFDDLAASLGGPKDSVTFRGQSLTVEQLRSLIPSYYFPINSQQDLIAKIGDVRGSGKTDQPTHPEPPDHWEEPNKAVPPGLGPPEKPKVSDEEHQKRVKEGKPTGIKKA